MKLNTLILIDKILKEEDERRLDALREATKELDEKEKKAGISSWQTGDEVIQIYRKIKYARQEAFQEIKAIRQDWNRKEWG